MTTTLQGILNFFLYLSSASVLLALFVAIYVRATPYKEFALIHQNNNAAAISLGGAVLGFTMPLVASIYYTHSVLEMALWATITCATQLVLFVILRRQAPHIEAGHTAPAIMLATFSIAVGALNAVSISY
jgi:putative membrane protein